MRLSRRTISEGRGRAAFAGRLVGVSALGRRPAAQTAPRRKFRRSCSCTAMATMRRSGSPPCGGWNRTACRASEWLAINFTDPLARTDDKVEQANRSSTEDQRRELGEAVKELQRRTGAARIALVGNSRGGYSIRNYIRNGGGADISHAVLCGVPNHGVYDWDDGLGQRVQRPRPVPARPERGRQRGDAGHGVPHACAATASTNSRKPTGASSASRARRPA